ncbi:hypothetical protein MY802_06790 [Haemophilus influenzae]
MEEFYILGKGKYSSEEFFNTLNLPEQQSDLKLVFLPYSERLLPEYNIDNFYSVIISDEPLDDEANLVIIQEQDFLTKERAIFALEILIAWVTNSNIVNWNFEDYLAFVSDFKKSNIERLAQSNWVGSPEELLVLSKINIDNICRNVKLNRVNKIYSFLFCNHLPEFSIIPAISD